MVETEGMFSTIATITNFIMQFLDNEEILGYCIIIFRRLHNFFPQYHKHLEEPIINIMINVLQVYKKAMQIPDDMVNNPIHLSSKLQKEIAIRLYERSQAWFNYLTATKATSQEFKDKLETKEGLKYFRIEKNRDKFPCENPDSPHIKTFVAQDLQLSIGQYSKVEIDAGSLFSFGIDIKEPNSMINLNMNIEMYDIKVGLYKATPLVEFIQKEEKVTNQNTLIDKKNVIEHPMTGYECIIDSKLVERKPNEFDITINYKAVEPGFYRIAFSNEHSWVTKKTVLYRYCVLVPVNPVNKELQAESLSQRIEQQNLIDMED